MVHDPVEQLGRLDLLVNNAGGYATPSFPTNDDWRSPLELNLLAVRGAIKVALPARARRPGCVVNVASSAGHGSDAYRGVECRGEGRGLTRGGVNGRTDPPHSSLTCLAGGRWFSHEQLGESCFA